MVTQLGKLDEPSYLYLAHLENLGLVGYWADAHGRSIGL
jgi:hypothetical protein